VFDDGIAGAIRVNQLLHELEQERQTKKPPEPPAP
jgi:hypothetical protein